MFTSLISGHWKFETPGSACQESKEFFLVWFTAETLSRNLGFTCHFSSLTITSLFSGRIFDTIRLIYIPNNSHLFTWLEMIQNEWDEDVSSIAIKCGNNCGWKRMSSSCSINDLTVLEWSWIRLFCTGRLNTRQEDWLLPESQLSKSRQRWWVGLVFVHKKIRLGIHFDAAWLCTVD